MAVAGDSAGCPGVTGGAIETALHFGARDLAQRWAGWLLSIQWPDGDDGAWYTRHNQQIHISHQHEWSDEVPTHEYGHHFLYNYAETPLPDSNLEAWPYIEPTSIGVGL